MVLDRLAEPRFAVSLALVLILAAGLLFAPATAGGAAGQPQAVSTSGRVLGQLLGGVRTAAAAYLWIKTDSDHDTYYGDLTKEAPLIPLYRIQTWLDPKMERAYFVASYMLWQQRKSREAIEFAKEGLSANPRSPLLTFNLGQLYFLESGDEARDNALRYLWKAERMTRGADPALRMQVLSSLSAVYGKWKIPGRPAWIKREIEELARKSTWEEE